MENKSSAPTEQPEDVLVQSKFHKTLLLFHIPAAWSAWKVAALGVFFILTISIWWFVMSRSMGMTIALALGLLVFFVSDGILFAILPNMGTSFGPWQSQLFAVSLPRWVASILFGLAAAFVNPSTVGILLLVVQMLGTSALLYGTLVEPVRLKLTHLRIKVEHLTNEGELIRILHISDLHIERLTRREQRLLEIVREVEPDLILITGDYPNLSYTRDPVTLSQIREILGQLSAPYGVAAILGSPPVDEREVVPALFDDLDIRLLVDDWEVVKLDNGLKIVIMGVDCSHHLPTDRQRFSQLINQLPEGSIRILLHHSPDLMPEASEVGIDLYLCGHTHGGQIRLPFYGAILTSSQLGKRYEMGHYQNGRTNLYVSRGVGLEGLSAPRVRFLAPPEITLITLSGNHQ